MSGAFYGALAASASVFVAILTALLVNNYVTIKADRRQLTHRINEKKRQLKDLKQKRDEYRETVDQIRTEREKEYRAEAEENIDGFINDHLSENFHYPIENLTVDRLYKELLDYKDYEDADELEESEEYQHHKDVLEDRLDQIKELVLNRTVHEFASNHEGEGVDRYEKLEDDTGEEEDEPEIDKETQEIIEAIRDGYEPLELDDFIEKYKDEYDLEELNKRSKELLEKEYDEVVDKEYSSDKTFADVFPPTDRVVASILEDAIDPAISDLGVEPAFPEIAGADIGVDQQEQRYERSRDNLIQTKSEIESLERVKEDLERQKERLNPEDLKTTLYANAVTIFLSVVIPMAAYLATETGTTITVPQILSHTEINVFISWLTGLVIVFVAIYCRLTKDS